MTGFTEMSHCELMEVDGGLIKFLVAGYALGWVAGRTFS